MTILYRITDYSNVYHPSHVATAATKQAAIDHAYGICRDIVALRVLQGLQDGDEYPDDAFRLSIKHRPYQDQGSFAWAPHVTVNLYIDGDLDTSLDIRSELVID